MEPGEMVDLFESADAFSRVIYEKLSETEI